jgi:two-component system response regulator FlrC
LLESELFGHEKGAFTGAIAKKLGKFEEANNGTLLLDEISEMHVSLQAKLLRALQERVIDRVGGKAPVKVDVRIIATSNRDLQKSVDNGDFREDLFFRLNVVNLPLPALRERPADIAPLAQFFIDKYADVNGVAKKKLSDEAKDKIQSSRWRGNVRELENAMHRAVLISIENEIEADAIHLSDAPATTDTTDESSQAEGGTLANMEKNMIINTLDQCLGNRTQAAKILGISIRTLRNKLGQYNMADDTDAA